MSYVFGPNLISAFVGRENSKHKCPEAGRAWLCWRDSLKASGCGSRWSMGRVPWDVVEGPIVHTERLFLDFLLRASGSHGAGGRVLTSFFISSGFLSADGCVKRGC